MWSQWTLTKCPTVAPVYDGDTVVVMTSSANVLVILCCKLLALMCWSEIVEHANLLWWWTIRMFFYILVSWVYYWSVTQVFFNATECSLSVSTPTGVKCIVVAWVHTALGKRILRYYSFLWAHQTSAISGYSSSEFFPLLIKLNLLLPGLQRSPMSGLFLFFTKLVLKHCTALKF